MKKLRSSRGETLTETLAAILIVTLSSMILLTGALASARINQTAQAVDETLRTQQMAAEQQTEWTEDTVTVQVDGGGQYTYRVHRTGAEGDIRSYALAEAGT